MRLLKLSIALVAVVSVASCSGGGKDETVRSQAGGKRTVYVVNYPLQYFAERIGGEHIDVVLPAGEDGDPAFWEPTPENIAAYQSADLILLNGAGYAKWVPKVSLPQSRMVDTSALFANALIDIEEAVTHSHGPGGEHAHTGTAFTTWLDFSLAAEHVHAITNAFGQRWPEHADAFRDEANLLIAELEALDDGIGAMIAGDHQPVVASHPVYQYLARRYGVNLRSVVWEPKTVPTERQWAELQQILESHPAKWMMWEGVPNVESIARLGAMGVGSIVFDPCGRRPEDGDFMSAMRDNVSALKRVFAR